MKPVITQDPPFQLPLVLFVPAYILLLVVLYFVEGAFGHAAVFQFLGSSVLFVWVLFGGGAYQYESSFLNFAGWNEQGIKIYAWGLWALDLLWIFLF